jgi:hypothetical protein
MSAPAETLELKAPADTTAPPRPADEAPMSTCRRVTIVILCRQHDRACSYSNVDSEAFCIDGLSTGQAHPERHCRVIFAVSSHPFGSQSGFKLFNTKWVGDYEVDMNRRNVLVGLGGLVAGGGALIGTGAFTTVEAERTVSVETAGDANAFLALAPADRDGDGNNAYVEETDGTIQINLDGSNDSDVDGLNQNAITTFRNLVTVSNNGTQTVESLTLTMDVSNDDDSVSEDDTFEFTVSPSDGNSNQDTVSNSSNILSGNNSIPSTLDAGNSINFGLIIDLINGGDGNDLPTDDGETYTLTIEAQTANSN